MGSQAMFLTPTRILVPKLLKSRDGWKAKAGERKRKLKAATVRLRDLEASRAGWRERAEAAERELARVNGELDQTRQTLVEVAAEAKALCDDAPKKMPPTS